MTNSPKQEAKPTEFGREVGVCNAFAHGGPINLHPENNFCINWKEAPWMEFIGTVRRRLFLNEDSEWNGLVRDYTAKFEHPGELVNAAEVSDALAHHFRDKAHWVNFGRVLSGLNAND